MSNNKGTVLKVIGMRKIMIFKQLRKPNREIKADREYIRRVPQGCHVGPGVFLFRSWALSNYTFFIFSLSNHSKALIWWQRQCRQNFVNFIKHLDINLIQLIHARSGNVTKANGRFVLTTYSWKVRMKWFVCSRLLGATLLGC